MAILSDREKQQQPLYGEERSGRGSIEQGFSLRYRQTDQAMYNNNSVGSNSNGGENRRSSGSKNRNGSSNASNSNNDSGLDCSTRQSDSYGFGSSQKRFQYKSMHPAFSKSGGVVLQDLRASSHLSPGCYEVKSDLDEKINKQWGKRGPYDVTTGPRFRSKGTSSMGPGYYTRDLLTENEIYKKKSFGKGICDYTGPRSQPLTNTDLPGVGSYEFRTFLDDLRARSVTPIGVCSQSPGERLQIQTNYGPVSYKLKSSVEELLEKKISTRGPYELTTGSRFKKIDKTYAHLGPGMYSIERMQNLDYDIRKGKWGNNERFRTSMYTDHGVAPGTYDISKPIGVPPPPPARQGLKQRPVTSQGLTNSPSSAKGRGTKVFVSGARRFCPRFDRIASLDNFVVSAGSYDLKSPNIFERDTAVTMKSTCPRFQNF
eukprot:Nk52_evm1s2361 gene=Nk52_evmTU1s2361